MTENKRFELQVDPQGKVDIIDWVESKEKNAICIYNDLGVLPFSSAKALCDLLNELSEENEQLKRDRNEMFIRERDTENELRDIKIENEQLKGKVKRLKCINKQLEDRLGGDIALNMDCGEVE